MDHTVFRAPEGETTEWEDLQRKFGNLPKLPVRAGTRPRAQRRARPHLARGRQAKKDDYYAEEAEPKDARARIDETSVGELREMEVRRASAPQRALPRRARSAPSRLRAAGRVRRRQGACGVQVRRLWSASGRGR